MPIPLRVLFACLAALIVSPLADLPARAARPAASAPASFTLEHALTISTISDLTWSSDGRRLAFVVNSPDTAEDTNNQDIWLIEGGALARRLTRHPKNDFSPTASS